MPDLQHRLRTLDLSFLKIIADLWGLDLDAPDVRAALSQLTRQMLTPALVQEVVLSLPEDARQALDALTCHSGWLPWTRFTHRFGTLREVGPGKRDREKPYLDPVSPTERLWYYALIGRDFLMREGELQECAYIPDDLLPMLPPVAFPLEPEPPGRAASPGEAASQTLVSDRILDHTCTLLAALRLEDSQRSPAFQTWQPPLEVIHALLAAMKLISSSEQPVAEDARPFLEMPRGKALAWLVRGWRESDLFNELRLVPGVVCEGAWNNDPRTAREKVLAWISEIPDQTWWNLESFVSAIYQREPDFQRPAGDFDTWLIRDADSGESLQGVAHWDDVDGALVRYLITGPMHWLGLVDLASPGKGERSTAFRLSSWAPDLLLGKPLVNLPEEDQPIRSFSDASVIAGIYSSRLGRYQISRFCLWTGETETSYHYQLSPDSLKFAAEQGLKIAHLETLFTKYGEKPQPTLMQALHQWEQKGSEVQIYPCVIVKVATPQILKLLRDSPAGRFVEDPLGPTAAIIHPGAARKVSTALARLGYLSEVEFIGESIEQNDSPEL